MRHFLTSQFVDGPRSLCPAELYDSSLLASRLLPFKALVLVGAHNLIWKGVSTLRSKVAGGTDCLAVIPAAIHSVPKLRKVQGSRKLLQLFFGRHCFQPI